MSNELSLEEVQEAIDLTPGQLKAWATLVKAVNKCKKEGVYFYSVLDSMGALNGNNVRSICCPDDKGLECMPPCVFSDNRWLGYNLDYPAVDMSSSFADDTHYVRLHNDY